MSLQMQLSLELPPGYHLTKGASSNFQAYTSGKTASGTFRGPWYNDAAVTHSFFHSPKLQRLQHRHIRVASATTGNLKFDCMQVVHCSL